VTREVAGSSPLADGVVIGLRVPGLFLAKLRSGGEMGLICRLGGGFGSSFRLGIGCTVTADQHFRQRDCSGDADQPALASMSPRDRRREFPLPAQDAFGPWDSSGRIRSSGVSDAAH